MTAADLFVGKPGGLTTSEAMAKGLPMVVINPIPGQEERNSDHLLEEGVALRCNNLPALAYKIDSLLDTPGKLARMAESAASSREARTRRSRSWTGSSAPPGTRRPGRREGAVCHGAAEVRRAPAVSGAHELGASHRGIRDRDLEARGRAPLRVGGLSTDREIWDIPV